MEKSGAVRASFACRDRRTRCRAARGCVGGLRYRPVCQEAVGGETDFRTAREQDTCLDAVASSGGVLSRPQVINDAHSLRRQPSAAEGHAGIEPGMCTPQAVPAGCRFDAVSTQGDDEASVGYRNTSAPSTSLNRLASGGLNEVQRNGRLPAIAKVNSAKRLVGIHSCHSPNPK